MNFRWLLFLLPWSRSYLVRRDRQRIVGRWARRIYGVELAASKVDRGAYLLQEALKTAQACGVERPIATRMVNVIYGQPATLLHRDLGTVSVCLLALAEASILDLDECERREIARALQSMARTSAENKVGPRVAQ